MLRFLMYAALAYLAYRLLKFFSPSFSRHEEHTGSSGNSPQEAELIQDPQCGAYFLKQKGVKGKWNGDIVYFCSETCRKNYMNRHEKS